MKTSMRLGVMLLGLLWLAAATPKTVAVVPPPDGGYPNFNTAEGQKALFSLTTGAGNTAVGWLSLQSNTDGSFNTGVGAGTLLFNTGNQSVGEGIANTAIGTAALLANSIGSNNTAVGVSALSTNTSGSFSTAIGANALRTNTTASNNTAIGNQALENNTTGGTVSGVGTNEFGPNTAVGAFALLENTEGSSNTAVGTGALQSITIGTFNTAVGFKALAQSTESPNDAFGYKALGNNTNGVTNTAVGDVALFNNTSGSNNVALGAGAGINQTTGNGNVYIGHGMGGVSGESNACYIKSIFGQTSAGGVAVLVNSDNKLGTQTSSNRFKEAIKPMDRHSEALYSLQPVTFRYKNDIDPNGTLQFGLIAEDVEPVNAALVVRDSQGKPYSVRYDQVNAMLLNEFLKEHRRVEEQQVQIIQLISRIANQEAVIAQQQQFFQAAIGELKTQMEMVAARSD